jgi:hypothetical protein
MEEMNFDTKIIKNVLASRSNFSHVTMFKLRGHQTC